MTEKKKAVFHLPGLFEFYDFYKVFLPVFYNNRELFYDWCQIGSIYGSPGDCLWGGGRVGFGNADAYEVADLMKTYGISARLTFSNSLLQNHHLSDKKCNQLCKVFSDWKMAGGGGEGVQNGVIIHSDLLLDYLKSNFPDFYFVSSTTKVITDFDLLKKELENDDFKYVVPDFRLNKDFDNLNSLSQSSKDKVEFLCNECCWTGCQDRKLCYENVSRKNLGLECADHLCRAPGRQNAYVFSKAMESPAFIGVDDIKKWYLPKGFTNFKIEGRSLGSALILEFLLYYMTRPEGQLKVREMVYLDSSLDLF